MKAAATSVRVFAVELAPEVEDSHRPRELVQ
jgi:hypothetical protein